MTLPERLSLRFAREDDIPLVLRFIRELADYEHMLDEVVATEELLREWMFERRTVEALLAELDGEPVGFACFSTTFPPFWGGAESIWRTSMSGPRLEGGAWARPCSGAWPRWPWNEAAAAWNGVAWTGTNPASPFTGAWRGSHG